MDHNTAPTRCQNGNCVDITKDGDDFVFTSTVSPARGFVTYDRGEVSDFFGDVKAGKWDHLLG